MHVLFDTGVILNFLKDEPDENNEIAFLIDCVERKRITGWMTSASFSEIAQTAKDSGKSLEIIKNLLLMFRITSVDEKILHAALKSPVPGFENALITESAKSMNLDCVVSLNRELWEEREIRILSPFDLTTIIEHSGM